MVKVTQIGDGPKRGRGRPKKTRTVIAGGTSTTTVIAPEPEPLDLGPVILPSPEDAVRVLAELAALNDAALRAQAVYLDLKERAKTAKDKYDTAAEAVLTKLKQSTHASALPLFSLEEREADQRRMEDARSEGLGETEASERAAGEAVAPLPPSESILEALGASDEGIF